MACITTGRCKLVPWQRSAPAQDCQRSRSTQESPQFVPSNKRPRNKRGDPSNRGQILQRQPAFVERRPTPRPPVTTETAPPVYLNILAPSHIEPTPSYYVNLPPLVIPPLSDQYQEAPLPPTPLTTAILEGSELIGRAFQTFLPEDKYLATTIPTRDKHKFSTFHSHCWYLLQAWTEQHIEHPLSELTHLIPDPIIFAGFLWKYRTSVTSKGILEDYQVIARSDTIPAVPRLLKGYTVFYGWTENTYSIAFAWTIGNSLINNIPQSLPLPQKTPVTYQLYSLIGLLLTTKEIELDSPNSAMKQFGT